MKLGRELNEDEVRELIPSGLLEALNNPSPEAGYCGKCDGLRNHTTKTCPLEHSIYCTPERCICGADA